ncbi:3-deoxy-D-manno-octulosonic acid transferase [Psychrobacter sp.]|uniref:3-deoxy-D-manno-octulosonic acid transferase n=1 Tax=Psychrobacter sp. TaxID=56811 RepID=UPI0025EEB998|nr:3-deoxy-D-manno-octulosonic acid transferase [Psychrobacter sp.]
MAHNKKTKAANSAYKLALQNAKSSTTINPPWYYNLAIKVLKPVYRAVLWRRYNKAKKGDILVADYKQEIDARYGRNYPDFARGSLKHTHPDVNTSPFNKANIWCHAVSLGETNTIAPMLKIMLQQGARLWITNTTQTGFARTAQLFSDEISSKQVIHTFVPVDDKAIIKKFIKNAKPDLAMFVETELWANILSELKQSDVPSVLVNARLSQKSFEKYAKYESVTKSLMHNISMIIAQDADSAKRFRKLGVEVVKIRRADSLKWSTGRSLASFESKDVNSTLSDSKQDLQSKFSLNAEALNRPIWVAGSTHEGEEKAVIEAHKQLITKANLANALLLLVPRHPERFDAVAELLEQSEMVYHRRSEQQLIDSNTQIYLADTMGELTLCYQLSNVAFVGGSLVDIGGHNPIEAAQFGKPIIMGPFTQSCHEVVVALTEVGALKVVSAANATGKDNKSKIDSTMANASLAESLAESVANWLSHNDEALAAGKKGQQLVEVKSDAMIKQLAMIEGLLKKSQKTDVSVDPKEEVVDLDHFKVRKRGEGES